MPPRRSVGPRPTHHIILNDGTTQMGLMLCDPRGNPNPLGISESPMPKTALQTAQGDPSYGTFVLPFVNVTGKDWSGGRGLSDASKDATRYLDSEGVDTRMGRVYLAPKDTITLGTFEQAGQLNWNVMNDTVYAGGGGGGLARAGSTFTAAGLLTWRSITIKGKMVNQIHPGDEYGWLDVVIYYDLLGKPNDQAAPLARSERIFIEGTTAEVNVSLPINATMFAGQTYWIVVSFNTDNSTRFQIAYQTGIAGQKIMTAPDGISWAGDILNAQFYYLVTNAGRGAMKFFQYRDMQFAITCPSDNTPPRMYINGHMGSANDNDGQLDKLLTGYNLTTAGDMAGKKIKIISGPGAGEWRTIVANTNLSTGNKITVTPPWDTRHSVGGTSVFAILGEDIWWGVTGHGLTKPPTDVLIVDDIIYIAQGEGVAIRRGRLKTDGAWDTWVADADNRAVHLEMTEKQATNSTRKIWRTLPSQSKVGNSDVKTWGTNLDFGATDIVCGNPNDWITNLIVYGQPSSPWILKEGSFGSIQNGIYAEIPLAEYKSVKSETNGRAATPFGVNLFFSTGDGWERYYDNRLDDLGPNLDEGLPWGRQWPIVDAVPVPGGIVCALDGGESGYSSLLAYNQLGWHEIFRGPIGKRITSVMVQTLPGPVSDRLWFNLGEELHYLPHTLQPSRMPDYKYDTSGYLITSWYRTGFGEINKFWRSLTLYTEDIGGGQTRVRAYYQVDQETNWHQLPADFAVGPVQEIALSTAYDVVGKRIRFKLELLSDSESISPQIISYNITAVVRVPPATAWSASVLSASYMQDQQGRWEEMSETAMLAQLRTWANSNTRAAPILLTSEDPAYNNKRVFIDPFSLRPTELTVNGPRGSVRRVKVLNFSMVAVEEV